MTTARKFFTISGFKIEVIDGTPTTDVRFFSQRQLVAACSPEAAAELARRAQIVAARSAVS
jgi:hypothetical protein